MPEDDYNKKQNKISISDLSVVIKYQRINKLITLLSGCACPCEIIINIDTLKKGLNQIKNAIWKLIWVEYCPLQCTARSGEQKKSVTTRNKRLKHVFNYKRLKI